MTDFKVAFVIGQQWGNVDASSYENLATSLKENILLHNEEATGNGIEIHIFTDPDIAKIAQWVGVRGAIVFFSRAAKQNAVNAICHLKRLGGNRKVRVVILTGLIPEEEILYIDKMALPSGHHLLRMLKS